MVKLFGVAWIPFHVVRIENQIELLPAYASGRVETEL
jgi:hypothetical protein